MKKREEKLEEYKEKYKDIPRDYDKRLEYLFKRFKFNENKKEEINKIIEDMKDKLKFNEIKFVLYEEPEGAPRPRFRLVNRKNLLNMALSNNSFVHVYSPVASSDSKYMEMSKDDLIGMKDLIYTPCMVVLDAYIKTPNVFNQKETILAEMGDIRPVSKPDWDNIGKKYSDMMNGNVWVDDAYTISGTVNKYYSILPRVEIKIYYLNNLYNKYQYKKIKDKVVGADYYKYDNKKRENK